MVTLIIIAAWLYLVGAARTLMFYLALIVTCITLVLALFVGGSLSYLFWPESVRAFEIGSMWANDFMISELWQAPIIPVLFFFDLIRIGFKFCWQCPNIFSIGVFGYWWYLMYLTWGRIAMPFIFARTLQEQEKKAKPSTSRAVIVK